jgi:predicted RNase H-like HicB family nuclease
MKKIKIIIERGVDLYAAYAPEVEGLSGAGETVGEAKLSLMEAKEILLSLGTSAPSALKAPFEFEYSYDVQSLLNYYKGVFTNSALERITGVNQRLLHHYSTGLKKPRPDQRKKIENGLHQLANELLTIEL